MRVAAIDVGTNTVRLLVADGDEAIDRDSRITRLGEGVDASGRLGDEPMRRTLETLTEFVERARAAGAERIRIAGTSALRDAENRRDFTDQVERACGIPLEVLEGIDEGRLAYIGATSWLQEGAHVVCDIGGGSTELITATDVISIDIGSVRVRERYLRGDPPTPESLDEARSEIRGILYGLAVQERIKLEDLVGVAGTITTIAALAAGYSEYQSTHEFNLTQAKIDEWAERLNAMTADEIRALGPVAPGRADVIGAGALVLEAVVEILARDVLVSERDILNGLVADLVR